MVIRSADVGDRDPGLHPLPRHVRQRGDEEGAGGRQAREARALRQVIRDCDWSGSQALASDWLGLVQHNHQILGLSYLLIFFIFVREIYNMMFYCWDNDPQERPSFTQLVKVDIT